MELFRLRNDFAGPAMDSATTVRIAPAPYQLSIDQDLVECVFHGGEELVQNVAESRIGAISLKKYREWMANCVPLKINCVQEH